ncbi:MAG: SIS domain-containing protein [Pseudomonadota bacterium]
MTLMRTEINEIPDAVARLLSEGPGPIQTAVQRAKAADPRYFVSVARGSSDHAATYLKYASELLLRKPMASVGPSVRSIYGVELDCTATVGFSVSQSGMSPDIVRMTEAIGQGGAMTIAITNDAASDLARVATCVVPIFAGPERSVAATKTFVTSLVAGLWILAELADDKALIDGIHALPPLLAKAASCDWSAAAAAITGGSLFTVGRGPAWAISNEAALKFKETCQIHAESYSAAEVMHGPMSIIEEGFPLIAFCAGDAAEPGLVDIVDALADKGAAAFVTSALSQRSRHLPHVRTGHWLTDPITTIVSFYAMVETIALARGIDPDAPRHLKKVTETV